MGITVVAGHSLQQTIARSRADYNGPSLIYDLDRIGAVARSLALIGRRTGIDFVGAAKALPFDGLLDAVGRAFGGFDASNGGELVRLAAWQQRTQETDRLRYIAMSGPALSGPRPSSPLAERLTVNIESVTQLDSFDHLARWGVVAELGLRIGLPLYRQSASPMTRFGFAEGEVYTIQNLARHPRFAGFHCHIDGDQAVTGAHLLALERLVRLGAELQVAPAIYNLGGGFRDQSLEEIARLCALARSMAPSDTTILFEPGGWLAAHGGYGFCKVLAMRHRPDLDATLVTVDLARDAHCRWSSLRLEGWWGALPATRRLLVFGPTAYEGDYLGAFEWAGEAPGCVTPGGDTFALFGGVTGYAAAFNAEFNGIGQAKVISIGDVGAV